MALYVVLEKMGRNQPTVCWHVGEGELANKISNIQLVVEVMADGDELELINRTIEGIRKAYKKRTVTWRGDDATFIVENL